MRTKLLLLAAMTVTLFFSCNNKKPKLMQSANEALVKVYFENFNSHDWKKMADMYAVDTEFKDPALGSGIIKQTRAQIIQKYTELNKVFPDIKDRIVSTYPSGANHMIVEFISTGTAADNSKFELPICTIFTIEDGQITKDFTYYDNFQE